MPTLAVAIFLMVWSDCMIVVHSDTLYPYYKLISLCSGEAAVFGLTRGQFYSK